MQETFKNMRKLSIVLLLISISFMTMEANNLSERRTKHLVFERWHYQKRALVPLIGKTEYNVQPIYYKPVTKFPDVPINDNISES